VHVGDVFPCVKWQHISRQEPVIYVNGKPYSIREALFSIMYHIQIITGPQVILLKVYKPHYCDKNTSGKEII
jgi:hypothetical protein